MSLVTYVDVNSILVRGKIRQGNYREVLVVEVADTEDEKVVLVFNGSMASAMKQEMIRHVEEELPEEANTDERPQAAIDSESICIG